MADYVEKIQNLLDLAKSTNEYEARSAMLKARELMAKHKISEKDLKESNEQDVKRVLTTVDFTKRRDPWVSDLAITIAKYYCCKNFQSRAKGKQTATVGFLGLPDDVTICVNVFNYAVNHIHSRTKEYRKLGGASAADGYGFGFVVGLEEAYEKQEKGWGLVLTIPDAVNDAHNKLKKRKCVATKPIMLDGQTFKKGRKDGHKFDLERKDA